MFVKIVVSLLLLSSSIFAQNCGYINVTSQLVDTVVILTNASVYRIVVPQNDTKALSGKAALLPANDPSCPKSCTYELLSFSSPKNDSILHVRGEPYPLIVPPGYKSDPEKTRLSCARQSGDCGASIPIYRHYKFTSSGLVHSYSYDQSPIAGFVREFAPICYGWPSSKGSATTATPAARTTSTTPAVRPKRSDETEGVKKTTATASKAPPTTAAIKAKGSLVWLGDQAMWLFPNGSLANITIG